MSNFHLESTSPETDRIIVVGAGLAGITAALHLAERGLSPVVLEADPKYCGGRLAGGDMVEVDGWRFRGEHGVHGIWSPYRNLQAMLARHVIRPVLVPAQEETWIYKRGDQVGKADVGSAIRHSWLPAPLHYLTLFLRPRFLGILKLKDWLSLPLAWYGLMLAVAIDPLREGQPMEGMWLSDLVKRWSPALRAFFVGLARNGMPARPEEVPLSGFVSFLRYYTLLRRDAWAFSYLPADAGTALVEPLAAKLSEMGGRIEMGVRVEKLERDKDGWRVHVSSTDNEIGSLVGRQLILATDSPNCAKIFESSPDLAGDVADFFWPRGMATAIIRLWFNTSTESGAEGGMVSGDSVIDNYFWLHRLQDDYRKWHKATGGSAIEAHIYGPPELLEEPDAVLLARAISDVKSAFPELRGRRIHQTLQRNDATHTLFGVGSPDRHLGIGTPWPDLFCCGDWVYHHSPAFFMERACITGIEAANAVLKKRKLSPWPLLSYLPPERFVGFIERVMVRGRKRLLNRRRRRSPDL